MQYLPVLIDKVEAIMEEEGLRHDSITMRMTGCPNGCARPWAAEIAFVGKAPGSYLMLLGGGYHGQRLNKIYREAVGEEEIISILRPMIKEWAVERLDGEHFGDFVIRKGYIDAVRPSLSLSSPRRPVLTRLPSSRRPRAARPSTRAPVETSKHGLSSFSSSPLSYSAACRFPRKASLDVPPLFPLTFLPLVVSFCGLPRFVSPLAPHSLVNVVTSQAFLSSSERPL